MVKGISRQVIVVQSPEPKLFDQAIFILNENAVGEGVTEEILLKEAPYLPLRSCVGFRRRHSDRYDLAADGCLVTCERWGIVI